ncbi:MAG: ABC transporter permease [Chthoniobacter sp.]|nr:ABC transporter permease [Chthoniobacter sp.]
MKQFIAPAVFFAALLGAWEYAARHSGVSALVLPAPSSILQYLVGAARDGTLGEATLVTMKRLFLGYAAGLGFGIPLGMLTARFRFLQNTIGVIALGFQTLPSVCWVPLALLWFGQTETAMLFIVVMGTVWAVILATAHGIHQIPPLYREAASTMGSRGFHLWLHVLAPASLPHIVSGTKQGWAFAWRSLMAAEIYVTILSGFGIGHLLHYGRELHAMDQVVGLMLVIIVIGFLADKILFSPWERFLHRRWGLTNS